MNKTILIWMVFLIGLIALLWHGKLWFGIGFLYGGVLIGLIFVSDNPVSMILRTWMKDDNFFDNVSELGKMYKKK